MKPKTRFYLFRWIYHFLFWFFGLGISTAMGELMAGPLLKWLFHDIPYQLPTWNRAGRMAIFVVLSSLSIGTLVWFYEKIRIDRDRNT